MNTPLIPRITFIGNPDHALVRVSPDGRRLAWLAPLDGVLNVWLSPSDDPKAARPVTRDSGRGIRFFAWAFTNDHILYIQDANGDENWHIHAVNLANGDDRDLTPFPLTQARIYALSDVFPEEIVVGLNNRHPQWHDLHRLQIVTGKLTPMLEHDRFSFFSLDNDLRLREAYATNPDGSRDVLYPDGKGGFEKHDSIPVEDNLTTAALGFSRDGKTLFLQESRGRNTAVLTAVDPETRAGVVLAGDPRADLSDFLVNPVTGRICAAAFTFERKRWQALDPAVREDLARLSTLADGEFEIMSTSNDFSVWIVASVVDAGPVRYFRYDRKTRTAKMLFTNRAALEGLPLAPMRPAVITSRDGLDLVCYYTLPPNSDADGDGIPDRPLPLVFNPHGGPWARDYWGYDGIHQWLANRGYAVLAVNFRASWGFGKSFLNAGNREWGGKILQDQIDAVEWMIRQKIADPDKMAVLGGSFGGYSTLAQLTMNPETFACGVDIVGPSHLQTLLESVPDYWKPDLEDMVLRVGDHRTEEGRALLARHSPLTHADRIVRPLLIAQGANDPRVKRAESDRIVQAMKTKGIPVTYVLFPDEGHGFARPENRLAFYAIAEAFLAKHLGGRCQPVGDDFTGSSHEILADSGGIPGR